MKATEEGKRSKLSRRVWTICQRGGNVMKFEVSLDNHHKLEQAVETIRGLMTMFPDMTVIEHEE